jgi:signal transduction histidine kinase
MTNWGRPEGLRPEQRRLQAACDGLLGHINDVSENIRRLSRDLSPYVLEDLGLSAAIRWLVEKSCKHGNLESSLDMTALEDLFTRERQITVYRIVQECLTNIAKHAQATRVSVTITKQDDLFFFRVEDNGIGFDPREVLGQDPRTKGLGLAAMYERTRMLKGSLDIQSHRGTGTRISFSVPLDYGGSQL